MEDHAHALKRISVLKEAYGNEVLLVDENGAEQPFALKAEFSLGSRCYAALQSPSMRKEDEVEMFLIVMGADGTPQLETIEGDEEWEAASEAYDELLFAENV
ncbi:hypothetical protein VN24_18055 [Paenibacillus beijingensis]|uniref:DUF1292 domain-containing protein n=2 Tax=Paenibacillus beijingensis TaxID=1126833 RepID=A0A0D5NRB5_9BACL|nr:hypothetical protein VN24_18055 [Paenibacillus beijingensis]